MEDSIISQRKAKADAACASLLGAEEVDGDNLAARREEVASDRWRAETRTAMHDKKQRALPPPPPPDAVRRRPRMALPSPGTQA